MNGCAVDREYLLAAYVLAREKSNDPSTQNGALLVDFSSSSVGIVQASGVNEFPRGVAMSDERWQRPAKYQYIEHAERNAVFEAARLGIKTHGLTMYCPWAPCTDCARAIIQSGIAVLVTHNPVGFENPAHWADNIKIALGMLYEAGVIVRHIDGQLDKTGRLIVRRDGNPLNP